MLDKVPAQRARNNYSLTFLCSKVCLKSVFPPPGKTKLKTRQTWLKLRVGKRESGKKREYEGKREREATI